MLLDVCRPTQHPYTWVTVLLALLCLGLSVGILTPILAALALGAHAFCWATTGGFFGLRLVATLITAALIFLGPGAYSFDARLYGRKLVTFSGGNDLSDL